MSKLACVALLAGSLGAIVDVLADSLGAWSAHHR